MRVAAYQAPLLPAGSMDAIDGIRSRVRQCERERVEILCCPEGVLGGLADYARRPADFALRRDTGQLSATLEPLASATVTSIVGFTEIDASGTLYNSAAIVHRGVVIGLYRKQHPAIRRSVYSAGDASPVFTVNGLTFGIVICYDSAFPDIAEGMARQGATALFIPSNTALPHDRPDVVSESHACDIGLARAHGVSVIRADVTGRTEHLVSYGASNIVAAGGTVLQSGRRLTEELLVAEV